MINKIRRHPFPRRRRRGRALARAPATAPSGVAALGWGRRGSPLAPSAACQNSPSGFGGIVRCCFSVPEHIGLPEPGPQFREERGLFSPGAQVGLLVPRLACHDRLGRVVPPDKESPLPPGIIGLSCSVE